MDQRISLDSRSNLGLKPRAQAPILPPPTTASTTPAQSEWRPLDVVCSVAFALLFSQAALVGMSATPSRLGIDIAGVFFLVIALTYRGSVAAWWGFCAPVSLALLFAPIARWESLGLMDAGGLMRAALVPGLSFVGGALIAAVRDTAVGAFEASREIRSLSLRGMAAKAEIKAMESDVRELMQALRNRGADVWRGPALGASLDSSLWLTEPQPLIPLLEEDPAPAPAIEPIEAMSFSEIHRILALEVEAMRQRLAPGSGVRVALAASLDFTAPLAVRGGSARLASSARQLIALGVESLGGASGTVRVSLRPGQRSVAIMVEDNGRGLGEEMLARLEARGQIRRSHRHLGIVDIRELVQSAGWTMDIQAKLGVGARVILTLPRVDQISGEQRSSPLRVTETATTLEL